MSSPTTTNTGYSVAAMGNGDGITFSEAIIIIVSFITLCVGLIFVRLCCNAFLDICLFCDIDAARQSIYEAYNFIHTNILVLLCPCWFSTNLVQENNNIHANNDENENTTTITPADAATVSLSSNTGDDYISTIIDSELSPMTDKEKNEIFCSFLTTKEVCMEDLMKWVQDSHCHSIQKHNNDKDSNKNFVAKETHRDIESQNNNSSSELICSICINQIEIGDNIVILSKPCNHKFHKECILQWLSPKNRDCPYCRREIISQTNLLSAILQYRMNKEEENEKKQKSSSSIIKQIMKVTIQQ